jgi:hypothetical protein
LVCLLEAFSLGGWTCHVARVAVTDTVPGTEANINILTQDLFRKPTSFWNTIKAATKDWRVLGPTLSHLCRLILEFSLATRHFPHVTYDASVTC